MVGAAAQAADDGAGAHGADERRRRLAHARPETRRPEATGHYASAQLGEADITGTVEGSKVTVKFSVAVQGTHLDVVYTGTLEGKDSMKGTVNLGGLGEGTFTGKKQ